MLVLVARTLNRSKASGERSKVSSHYINEDGSRCTVNDLAVIEGMVHEDHAKNQLENGEKR